MLLFDPLYLALLSGVGQNGVQSASNLFSMGPLLSGIADACLKIGCTPVLAHHFKLTRGDHYAEPQLEDLAFSGIQEFAAVDTCSGGRDQYQPGTGQHSLWLSVGGSAGHSGLWSVDVEEGTVDEHFSGRRWGVTVNTAAEAGRPKAVEGTSQGSGEQGEIMKTMAPSWQPWTE